MNGSFTRSPPKSVTYVLNLLCYLCPEPAPTPTRRRAVTVPPWTPCPRRHIVWHGTTDTASGLHGHGRDRIAGVGVADTIEVCPARGYRDPARPAGGAIAGFHGAT